MRKRERKVTVAFLLVAVIAAVLVVAGCGEGGGEGEGEEYVGICVDPGSGVRVDDDRCDRDMPGYVVWWMLLGPGGRYPAVGGAVDRDGFVTKPPSGASTRYGGLSRSGGTVKAPSGGSTYKPGTGTKPKAPAPKAPAPAPKPKVGR